MALSVELEEWVGSYWHRWVSRAASWRCFPDAAVTLDELGPSLAVFFRAGGGDSGLALNAGSGRESRHRLNLRQRLGFDSESLPQARRDNTTLYLPDRLDLLPQRALNRDLYFWLAAFMARMPVVAHRSDPLQRDIDFLRLVQQTATEVTQVFPGLLPRYKRLCEELLVLRPGRAHLPVQEAAIESAIRHMLGDHGALGVVTSDRSAKKIPAKEHSISQHALIVDAVLGPACTFDHLHAARHYRSFLPVPLWGITVDSAAMVVEDGKDDDAGVDNEQSVQSVAGGARKAQREYQDQAEREDTLIFNRFEKMLSFADMVNLRRMVDDEEDDRASKTAEQMEELTLSPNARRAASRLQVELDMPSDAIEEGELCAEFTYPEWHYRRQRYLPGQSRVELQMHTEAEDVWLADEFTRRRIRAVQRQFEALRPRRVQLRAQSDGAELDTDAAVRSHCDQLATGVQAERVYLDTRAGARDLAVSVMVDVSLSTEAWLDDRRVIDVIREAIFVLAHGLQRCGDDFSITSFTSHRRQRVWLARLKSFDESVTKRVERRIAALTPGSYTRMGPAIRHAAHELSERPNRHRLLLLLSDGKPNDTDYYEGRYAIEDTRRAIVDARQAGAQVFGITVDRKAGQYVPRLFGRGGYALVDRPEKLMESLPRIYRQLTTP